MFGLINRKGLTLIELIVAMAIFGVIAVALIPVFTSSLIWIHGAGDKGEAYSIAQDDVEGRIATGDSYYSDDISLKFDGKDYSIRGGLVETTQIVNGKNSNLKTFVPLLPTITMKPIIRFEGDPETAVEITGINTNFNTSTYVELFDAMGTTKIGSTVNATVTDETKAEFNIRQNLLNNDYIVKVTTIIAGKPDEVSRAKYRVEQPRFMVVGDVGIYLSANGTDWLNRYTLSDITPCNNMKGIANNGERYVIVGDNGNTLISNENSPWIHKSISGGENITAVAWSPIFNKFYSVGLNGGIYSLDSSLKWTGMISSTTNQLRDITSTTFTNSTDTDIVNVVGENTILYSGDGLIWSPANITFDSSDSYIFNSVATGNDLIIAVGDDGYIGRTDNGIDWIIEKISPHNINDINDIVYNRDINEFIAVGKNGLILRSSDGTTWTNITSTIIDDFTGVFTQGRRLVIVGANGYILYSDDINSMNFTNSNVADKLNSVSGK